MEIHESFKYFAVLCFVSGWSAILLPLFVWGADKHKSISEHFIINRKSHVITAVLQVISDLAMLAFYVYWLIPALGHSWIFSAICAVTVLALIALAIIPTGKTRLGRVHGCFATLAFILFIPVVTAIALSPNLSSASRAVSLISLVGMLGIAVATRSRKTEQNYHLYFEGAYILLFDIGLLAAALLN